MGEILTFFTDIIQNRVFLAAGGSWLAAQASKNIYEAVRYGFNAKRLTGGGGMPSAHSATVTGLVVGCLMSDGAKSPAFAVALFFAMVVVYDAMGVRYETGQQARILNAMRLRDIDEGRQPLYDEPLDEKMGHTLAEVIVGIIVGIAVSLAMCMWAASAIEHALAAV